MKLFFTHKPLAMQNNCTKAESYQKLIRRDERIRKTVGITGFFGFFELFPLASETFIRCLLWAFQALIQLIFPRNNPFFSLISLVSAYLASNWPHDLSSLFVESAGRKSDYSFRIWRQISEISGVLFRWLRSWVKKDLLTRDHAGWLAGQSEQPFL